MTCVSYLVIQVTITLHWIHFRRDKNKGDVVLQMSAVVPDESDGTTTTKHTVVVTSTTKAHRQGYHHHHAYLTYRYWLKQIIYYKFQIVFILYPNELHSESTIIYFFVYF